MPQILLVNPRKRKTTRRKTAKRKTSTRKKPVKKRRTAKQKAATRKLVALNRRRGTSARRSPSKRRKNPVRSKTRRKSVARRASPVRRRRRRSAARRRNPSLTTRSIKNQVMDAGIGAGGALALDVVQGYLPIPATLKSGIVGTLVKAGLAIGIGIIGAKTKLVSNATAGKMANGALTVVIHGELKKQVQNFAPGIQMGEYLGEYLNGYDGEIDYAGAGLNPDSDGMGGPYLPELDDESLGFQQDGFGMGAYQDAEYMDAY